MKKYLCSLILTLLSTTILPVEVSLSEISKSPTEKEIKLNFQLAPDETILKQTLKISLNSPYATLASPTYSENSSKQYLPDFKDSKEVFNQSFTATTTIQQTSAEATSCKLHVTFLPTPNNKTQEHFFTISFKQKAHEESAATSNSNHLTSSQKTTNKPESWVESFQNVVQTTESTWVRLLFAFLLGLLLSLTPCIYPMIPITIGILHRHGKKSLLHNFLGSGCYAVGLSTTFAILGLLAAFAGASFGGLLSNPLFVLILVGFIGFMSLSMIGLFDMPVPSFMKGNTDLTPSRFGPFLSAFFFGILSGTIASPCVSPGLALLLTIVATIGNVFAGFLLLFAFGIGMSTPLIIIGTFSTSLQMLPQAGQWMVEIKKLLGFVMLATCFYYLSNIMSMTTVMWLFVAYLLFAALFYIIDAQKEFNDKTKTIKSLIGIILLALTIFTGFKAYESTNSKSTVQEIGVNWSKDYDQALKQAKEENKLLLLDFWANHCTICKAIDKKIFDTQTVAQGLDKQIIFAKVDCTSSSNPDCSKLKQKYQVFAQPAILIINPEKETIIKKWSSEPYKMTPQEFVNAVKNL